MSDAEQNCSLGTGELGEGLPERVAQLALRPEAHQRQLAGVQHRERLAIVQQLVSQSVSQLAS